MTRFLLFALALLVACDSGADSGADGSVEEGTVPGPDGQLGVCCPPGTPSCNCTPHGGWAPSMAECSGGTCDARLWTRGTDEWGCSIIIPNGDFTDPANNCFEIPDMGVQPDGGSARPLIGEACTPERGCRTAAATCLRDESGEGDLGGPDDPILNYPEGEDSIVERTLYPDGWCNHSFSGETSTTCDPEDPEPVCTAFAVCAVIAIGPACAERCDPTGPANDICRDGYQCHPEHAGCLPGCQSDDQCRITRQDTNGVSGIQTPDDCTESAVDCTPTDCAGADPADPDACADPATNFDRLVYDTESSVICDPESFRCVD